MNADPDKDARELAAWRAGPWVLKSHHDQMIARLREQLEKSLAAIADMHAERIKEGRVA